MRITDWPMQERPREKLLRHGAGALSDAELLAIFLQTGSKGKTALDLARELLLKHKTLRCLLNAPESQIASTRGLGPAKFCMLQAVLELGRRQLEEDLQNRAILTDTNDAKKYLIAKLCHHKQEVFACIFLNSRHQVIKYHELFYGTIHCTPIYPRVIAQRALEYNASAIIFAHNHPSGSTQPSQGDITSTQELITLLNQLDIRILDHIIVGGNQSLSFADQGLL